jgi:hypothetical protein
MTPVQSYNTFDLLKKQGVDTTQSFNTKLPPARESQFQDWAKKNNRLRDLESYDMRGAWNNTTQAANGHWPDTYKKPNYPTFSNESKYSTEETPGGQWNQDANNNYTSYSPSPTNMFFASPETMQRSAGMPIDYPKQYSDPMLGYQQRQPTDSENTFFAQNNSVGGYAAPDDSVVLNPNSTLSQAEKESVANNEALRLHMRKENYSPQVPVSPQQAQFYNGTAYANDPTAMRQTIIARTLAGDPTAYATPEQDREARAYQNQIRQRFPGYTAPAWRKQ